MVRNRGHAFSEILRQGSAVAILIILAASCAKMSSPAGGPRDKQPPVIVKCEPQNGQTNFRGNKITITFDEFVTLDKINEKFMVSPPLSKRPVISRKGKSVVIEYDEDLRDSTTYTFYFQDAIRDLNESNPIDNYQFVISTGPVVDSLSVTGNVMSAFSLDPPENTLVLLYRDHSDSAFIKSLPDYITKVRATGYFRIDNVKEGKYRIFALKDADNSKNFNLIDEEIAFRDSLIEVTAEKNFIPVVPDTIIRKTPSKIIADTVVLKGEYPLILFKPAKKARYLTSSDRKPQYKLVYTLSLPPDTFKVDFSIPGAAKDSYFVETTPEKDTLTVWITDSLLYSQTDLKSLISYPYTDSTGNIVTRHDTVVQRFVIPRTGRSLPKPTPLRVNNSFGGGPLKPGQDIVFSSQTPLMDPDTSLIRLYEVNEKTRIPVPYSFERDSTRSTRLFLKAGLRQKKEYVFISDSASFRNYYGEVSDSTGARITVRTDDTFSKLKIILENFEGNNIIQLLTDQEKVIRETKATREGIAEFNLLDKGKYRLRVIYDLNGDGKWTTGDFTTKGQPEPVSFYPGELNIPEFFWLDQNWNIQEKNFKKIIIAPAPGQRTVPGR